MGTTGDDPTSQAEPDVADEEAVARIRSEIIPFDPTLENLVMYINLLDTTEIGVTLHVKGIVVSGLLISARSYFNLMVHHLEQEAQNAEHTEPSGPRMFADFFRLTLSEFERARDEYRASEKLPPRPHHICLREVTSFTPVEPIHERLWRGRLTEIDGWSLGHFGERIPALPEHLR